MKKILSVIMVLSMLSGISAVSFTSVFAEDESSQITDGTGYAETTVWETTDYENDEIIYMDCGDKNISYNAETGFGSEPWSYIAVDADGNEVELTVDNSDPDLSDGTSKSDNASSTYRVGKYGFNTNPDSTGYTEIGYKFTSPYEGIIFVDFTRDIFGSNNENTAEMYIKIDDFTVVTKTWETPARDATADDKAINVKWKYIYEKDNFLLYNSAVSVDTSVALTGKMGGNYNKNMWITPVINYQRLSSKSMLQYYKDAYLDSLELSEAKRAEIDEYIASLPSADEIKYSEAEEAVLTIDNIIDKSEELLGDANGDGSVTILDATAIQKHIVKIPEENFRDDLADVNKDGSITIIDATLVQIMLSKAEV